MMADLLRISLVGIDTSNDDEEHVEILDHQADRDDPLMFGSHVPMKFETHCVDYRRWTMVFVGR